MPAGVSWSRYIRMFAASMLSMFAGAQAVHQYYRPDLVRFHFYLFKVFVQSRYLSVNVNCNL